MRSVNGMDVSTVHEGPAKDVTIDAPSIWVVGLAPATHPVAVVSWALVTDAIGAQLAESCLLRLCRVLGGGTYSRRSPFGNWFEDVRALGFLRPLWALAYDGLFADSFAPTIGS